MHLDIQTLVHYNTFEHIATSNYNSVVKKINSLHYELIISNAKGRESSIGSGKQVTNNC